MATVQLGTKNLGDVVKVKVNNQPQDFLVVNKSGNAVMLYMKGYYGTQVFNPNNTNPYSGSPIDKYANETFYNLIDANIRGQIINSSIVSNGSTIQRKVFLPSFTELGGGTHSYAPNEGTVWGYFAGINSTSSNTKRAYTGSQNWAWLRTPHTSNSGSAWCVNDGGNLGRYNVAHAGDFRPAFALPSTLFVSDDGQVSGNQPPTTPATITLPEYANAGEQFEIRWSAATDPDGDLAGYELDRSVNSGSSWTNVFKNNALSTTDVLESGTTNVMYRVRAYDTAGAYGGYKVSAQIEVKNNQAPTDPAALHVPEVVTGGRPCMITWEESTDPEADPVGYELEREVDGGGFNQIYKGQNMSYEDTIVKGWGQVAYRVRSYDNKGAYSNWVTSSAHEVNNNMPAEIEAEKPSGTDLGIVNDRISFTYKVTDEEGDTVNVQEFADSNKLKDYIPTLGEENTYTLEGEQMLKLANGQHKVRITANDGFTTNAYELIFEKKITELTVSLKEALTPADGSKVISVCALSITGQFPLDAELQILVTNNGLDDNPIWEDMTNEYKGGLNHAFANNKATKGTAFNFKITARRGTSGQGGYITSVQGGFQ